MVIGHEITHGFDDNGEEMTEKNVIISAKTHGKAGIKVHGDWRSLHSHI